MDLGDIVGAIIELISSFVDFEWCFRFWRFFVCLAAGLALAGLLDFLTGDHVPGGFLYVPLGLFGALAGVLWEVSDRGG